ncbi:MAG TPA: cytochrome d ubiquinol oxidase subunit II [Gammaproteobacteria bacterium]|nr:cytochrome d ubiquinol oxidase subunit II [Gammaproteobacteria bacterium]
MNGAYHFLADVWFGLIGILLILYVVLDGFDLGVGILSLFAHDERERGIMMGTLGSVWDANETWLVLLGGALFGAFPRAYAVVLHALYVPIMAALFGLIFRAVAFEFRENARRKPVWNIAFGCGSLLAAIAQGFALGAIIDGIPAGPAGYQGGVMDWFSPFALLVAIGVVFGYMLLGATYLIVKTVDKTQARNYRFATLAAWCTVLVGVGVSLWTPLRFDYVAHKWFGEHFYALGVLPLCAALAFAALLFSLRRRREYAPFAWSILIFLFSFIGLAASLYPNVVPPDITVYGAASSAKTLVFMLTGIGMLIPIMLIYNAYQYLVFRGKVTEAGYGGGED